MYGLQPSALPKKTDSATVHNAGPPPSLLSLGIKEITNKIAFIHICDTSITCYTSGVSGAALQQQRMERERIRDGIADSLGAASAEVV